MLLENWHYRVRMRPTGGDVWGLFGQRFGRKGIEEGSYGWISSLVEFDEINMTVKTISGSVYQLGDCDGNLEQQKQYIREDIEEMKKVSDRTIVG